MMSPRKKRNSKLFNFFQCKVEDSLHLEGLSSFLAQSLGELWYCKDLPNMGKLYLWKGRSTWCRRC